MKKEYRLLNQSESPPAFFAKLSEAVGKSWNSLGSISCKLNELGENYYEATFFPALREVFGGKDDGGVVFPGFYFNIGKFARLFDRSPGVKVSFDSLRKDYIPHLIFQGYLDGTFLKVIVMENPPSGLAAVERVYAVGPKKGTVEAIKS